MHIRTLCSDLRLGAGLAFALSACSFHAHSEFHTGTGGESSAGEEQASEPSGQAHEHHAHHEAHHEGHHSPAGRDTVVRVTSEGKPAVEEGGNGQEPARTAVHPTGDVPPSSGGAAAGAGASAGSEGASGGEGQPAATPSADNAPASGGEEAPTTSKGTNKSPSEPHVATPTRKPRKTHRTESSSSTNKEGPRE